MKYVQWFHCPNPLYHGGSFAPFNNLATKITYIATLASFVIAMVLLPSIYIGLLTSEVTPVRTVEPLHMNTHVDPLQWFPLGHLVEHHCQINDKLFCEEQKHHNICYFPNAISTYLMLILVNIQYLPNTVALESIC